MPIDWHTVSLLGIDVGYSETHATTGIAIYRYEKPLCIGCVKYRGDERSRILENGLIYDAIAIDGPLLPANWKISPRRCEEILSRGLFGIRCRAAPSHAGSATRFLEATKSIANDLTSMTGSKTTVSEAFPNAFLGVMLPEDVFVAYSGENRIKRGTRSDVYFQEALKLGCFDSLFDYLGWHDDKLRYAIREWAQPSTRAAHDIRAAIICVLTAGCAFAGQSEPIGDETGGFICLPPKSLWAPWARAALR